MASKKSVRSIIALGIIILLGLTGAGFLTYKLLHRAAPEVRAYRQAQLLMNEGRFEDACTQAQKALNYPSCDVLARQIIASCRVNLRQFDEAHKVLQDGLTEERKRQYVEGLKFFKEQMNQLDPSVNRVARRRELEKKLRDTNTGYGEYLELQLLNVRVGFSELQSLISGHSSELTLTAEKQQQSNVRSRVVELLNGSTRVLETMVREHPEEARVYQLMGELYKVRSQFVQASASAYLKEQRDFQLMDKHVEAGSAQRRARDVWAELPIIWQRALSAFQNAVHCDPDALDSRIELANLLRWGDNPDYPRALVEADEVLKRAKSPADDSIIIKAKIIRADLLRRTGKLDDAILDMAALSKDKPANNAVSLVYADLLLQRVETTKDPDVRAGSIAEAERVIQEAEKHARGAELAFQKSRLLIAKGEPTEATSFLSQIIDKLVPLEQGMLFTVRCYYYLGKSKIHYVEQARMAVEKADLALEDARKGGVKEKIDLAIRDKQAAEETYAKLATGAKSALDDLSESVYLMREVRRLFPLDERKRLDAQLVDAQTIVVQTMMARGELGDSPERLVQALTVNLDNDLIYRLLAKAIEKEKNADTSRRLTVNAVYARLLSGKYEEARVESEKALTIYGMTPNEAAEALKAPNLTPEQLRTIRDKVSGSEQLQAFAGIASLLREMTEPGMAHFQQASQLHSVINRGLTLVPDAYAQQFFARLVWTLYIRSMNAEAEHILDLAVKQFPASDGLMLTKAGMARDRGRLGSAIEAYQRAIQLAPNRGEYYTLLASLYLDLGMNDEAKALLARIPSDPPPAGNLLVEMAQAYSRLHDFDKTRKILADLLTRFGSDPALGVQARLVAASFYLDAGDFVQASRLVEQLPPNLRVPIEFETQRAGIFMNAGAFDKAAMVLEPVLKTRPDDPQFFTLGMLYLQLDEHPTDGEESGRKVVQALELAQRIQKDYKEYTHARLVEAVSFFQNDKVASAIGTLQAPFVEGRTAYMDDHIRQQLLSVFLIADDKLDAALKEVQEPTLISEKLAAQISTANRNLLAAISKLPPDQRKHALKALARSYLAPREQLWALSAANWKELAVLFPDNPLIASNLASAYANSGQSAKGRAILVENLKKNPDFAEGWRILGLLCEQDADLAGAESALGKAVAIVDDAPMVCVQLGEILDRDGKGLQAVPLYETVVKTTDRFPNALNNLAYHLITDPNPDFERGVSYAQRAVEFAPYEGYYRDTLGWAYYLRNNASMNDPDLAVQELEKAVQINPGSPEIRYHLAMAYLRHGNAPDAEAKKKAADSLREALAISPRFPSSDSAKAELQKLSSN